ncbi:protein Mo25-like [Eurytemora carolleeae]|uniref:protein Mo25-like n=1 Tax=Eurytemora carolleeae TaxID=1294199 RepID=UPI000C780ED1|nr:protein Mo25-like [Eurytemora carolleeae]|eukprot:XP_023323817.1 protein Mo25-like [Eurytemora affinis]
MMKMPLFGKGTKSPAEVARILKDGLLVLEKGGDGKKQEKAQEDVSKQFNYITTVVFGNESEQQSDILVAQLSQFAKVFEKYEKLLHSDNYVTRRQSLKLLGELLLDRHNFSVMTKNISNPDNLKLMMNMLKEKSRNIQFEAFHVFKVFVANPNKPKPILDILIRNQDKLVDFLSKFHTDRSEDEQFNDEKAYLIKQIKELKPLPVEAV